MHDALTAPSKKVKTGKNTKVRAKIARYKTPSSGEEGPKKEKRRRATKWALGEGRRRNEGDLEERKRNGGKERRLNTMGLSVKANKSMPCGGKWGGGKTDEIKKNNVPEERGAVSSRDTENHLRGTSRAKSNPNTTRGTNGTEMDQRDCVKPVGTKKFKKGDAEQQIDGGQGEVSRK